MRKELLKKERASVSRGKEKLKSLQEKFSSNIPKKKEIILLGDYVKVRSLGSTGRVVGLEKDGKTFEVVIGNVRTTVDASLLEKIPKPKGAIEKSSVQVHAEKVTLPEIKVIGMRVEEALKEIDRFLDRAMVQEISQIKIVHGIGTGKLMNAIREHLQGMSYIKDIKKDSTNTGITVIELT